MGKKRDLANEHIEELIDLIVDERQFAEKIIGVVIKQNIHALMIVKIAKMTIMKKRELQ